MNQKKAEREENDGKKRGKKNEKRNTLRKRKGRAIFKKMKERTC
jgi:hypothetical protein